MNPEPENEKGEMCDNCCKRKLSVSSRPNAYANEMGNSCDEPGYYHTVCDECDYQNRMDI